MLVRTLAISRLFRAEANLPLCVSLFIFLYCCDRSRRELSYQYALVGRVLYVRFMCAKYLAFCFCMARSWSSFLAAVLGPLKTFAVLLCIPGDDLVLNFCFLALNRS